MTIQCRSSLGMDWALALPAPGHPLIMHERA